MSNVHPWLGATCEKLRIGRLKYGLADLRSGGTPDTGNEGFWSDSGTPWVAISDMSATDVVSETTKALTEAGLRDKRLIPLAPGTLLYSMYASLGHVAELAVPAVTNQAILGMTFDKAVLPRYALWQLKAIQPYVVESASSNTQDNLNAEKVRNLPFLFPPFADQVRIANFLDEQTARIDALIAEKEALLLKLAENQYSYASQLMTQGRSAPLELTKTSFPELGSIPSHWTVKRLKFLGQVRSGIAKGKDHGEKDTVSLPYLRVANVQDGYVDLSEVLEIEVGTQEVERFLLKKGDVLMNEGGDNDKLGRGTVWEGQIDPCVHQNHVFAVRMFDTALAEWVARFTSTDAARTYFFLRSKQSTNLASINQTNVRELPVPMPPEQEREAILAEVRRSAKATLDLVRHVREHLDLLREYRASLVSSAVTGQLDVSQFKVAA